LSRTTQVSRYQQGKTNLDFTEARDSEWQWHQLGRMQVCTSLQTDNHTSTPPFSFLQARCPSCHPTNSIKALKVMYPISRTRFCYFAKGDGLVNKAGSFDVTANNNTSKSHDNVYGAIIMTKVIGRVHPVHLMNVD